MGGGEFRFNIYFIEIVSKIIIFSIKQCPWKPGGKKRPLTKIHNVLHGPIRSNLGTCEKVNDYWPLSELVIDLYQRTKRWPRGSAGKAVPIGLREIKTKSKHASQTDKYRSVDLVPISVDYALVTISTQLLALPYRMLSLFCTSVNENS